MSEGSAPWRGALTLLEIAVQSPAGFRPFIQTDPTAGPSDGVYWLVRHIALMEANTNVFSFDLYLCQRGFVYNPDNMTSGNGFASSPNSANFKNGVIKIAPHSGVTGAVGDETSLQAQIGDQAAALYSGPVIIPSRWFLLALMRGTVNPAPTAMGMKLAYHEITNGCDY